VPPHLSHFQPPNRVHYNNTRSSVFGIPNASCFIRLQIFSAVLRRFGIRNQQLNWSTDAALSQEHETTFPPCHWDLESNRPCSYGASSAHQFRRYSHVQLCRQSIVQGAVARSFKLQGGNDDLSSSDFQAARRNTGSYASYFISSKLLWASSTVLSSNAALLGLCSQFSCLSREHLDLLR
jgi:hypothetical protein